MKFEEYEPVAREAQRIEQIKAQMRQALAELDEAQYTFIVAARMSRICADLHDVCAAREWRRGFEAGAQTHITPRIGSGVTITDGEVR
jgi:hypothetical protein